jgi:hypothetical protein
MRKLLFLLLLLSGCSTAPLADTLDWCKPGKIEGVVPTYGGVCSPGPPAPVVPAAPAIGPALPPPPGAGLPAGPTPLILGPTGPQPNVPPPQFPP